MDERDVWSLMDDLNSRAWGAPSPFSGFRWMVTEASAYRVGGVASRHWCYDQIQEIVDALGVEARSS